MFHHPASLFYLPIAMTSTTQTICIKQHVGFPGHRSICPDIACLPLSRRAQVLKHLGQFHGSPSRAVANRPVTCLPTLEKASRVLGCATGGTSNVGMDSDPGEPVMSSTRTCPGCAHCGAGAVTPSELDRSLSGRWTVHFVNSRAWSISSDGPSRIAAAMRPPLAR
jgi:hypothetical protein